MNTIEKILGWVSIVWLIVAVVLGSIHIGGRFVGDAGMFSDEGYVLFWWVSMALILPGVLMCVRDIWLRFDSTDVKVKWYLLFAFIGTFAYPYYFLRHATKQRSSGTEV